jgi:SAM-dependent methyltransferase
MKQELIEHLRCPADGQHLVIETHVANGNWIVSGALINPRTGQRYRIENGIAYIHTNDATWTAKAREAAGWVQYHKDHHIYDQTNVPIDFQLPYFPYDPWFEVAHQFDIALDIMNVTGQEWVLDVGAGRGWAAKHFARLGSNTVAIDVNGDDQVGLGRSLALMQQANVCYDLIIGDNENLPFKDESFDIVFGAAVLHHTTSLVLLLQHLARVLRPGGRLVAITEPCVPAHIAQQEHGYVEEELRYGINETRPGLPDYRQALQYAGLQLDAIFAPAAYGKEIHDMESWSYELGISPPSSVAHEPIQTITVGTWSYPVQWMEHLLETLATPVILVASRPR